MKKNTKFFSICFFVIVFMLGSFGLGVVSHHYLTAGGNRSHAEIPHEDEVMAPIDNEETNENGDMANEEEVFSGEDEKEPIEEIINEEAIETTDEPKKKVFLTFDDGPTRMTPEVLRVLEEYNVKATFFVIGRMLERYPEIARKTYEAGHMLLPHSYSHNYSIYTSLETFYDDFYMAEETFYNILGFNPPPIFRFPGGSTNHSSFDFGGVHFMPKLTADVKDKGYYYIDWNIDSKDSAIDYDGNFIKNTVINTSRGRDFLVVLFHDVERNKDLPRILPEIIEFYKREGYVFRSFRDITEEELELMVKLRLANRKINR